ncbi:MAG: cellulose biosynthesis protein BcsS [Pseudolabrys sp.]
MSGRRVRAATAVAAAFSLCGVCLASGPLRADDDENSRALLFSGRDLWRHGAFAYGGLLIAPGGLEQDGLMLKLLLAGGRYAYSAGALGGERVTVDNWQLHVMPGWRIKRGTLETRFFFGADLQNHRPSPDDPDNRLAGRRFGLRFAFESWTEPTPESVVIADWALSSVGATSGGRLAYGLRPLEGALGNFYVGPEAQYFVSEPYRQMRLGLHVTAMKTEAYEWSAAGGWAGDTDGRAGVYLRLGLGRRLPAD